MADTRLGIHLPLGLTTYYTKGLWVTVALGAVVAFIAVQFAAGQHRK